MNNWVIVKDGNRQAYELFSRHYSFNTKKNRDVRHRYRFCPPGKYLALMLSDGKGLFVWSKELVRKDGQTGINCNIFRNESNVLSSDLIKQACEIGFDHFGRQRCYTFVNPGKVKSSNPGFCFKKAGWQACGYTKRHKLLILEWCDTR